MRILITGADGYIGWPLMMSLKGTDDVVIGIDSMNRRKWVDSVSSQSIIPIVGMDSRREAFREEFGMDAAPGLFPIDLLDLPALMELVVDFQPEAVVHLAEQPSAPYSMSTPERAAETLHNNVVGTSNLLWAIREHAPQAHILYACTMGEYGCYDDQTEILTRSGWVLFKDLTGEEEVATRSVDNRRACFKKPNSIHEYNFDGEMYHVKNNRLDLLVTPNHRMFTVSRREKYIGPLRMELAEDIPGKVRAYDIGMEWRGHRPGYIEILGKPVPSDLWMRFLGWYLSEGTFEKRPDRPNPTRVIIKQKAGENAQEIRVTMKAIADLLGTSFVEGADGDVLSFTIHGKDLAVYLSRFGRSAEKHIPEELKALDSILLRELLGALIAGDGWTHHRGFRYFSISKQLADDVQEVSLKCGWAATISEKDGGYIVHLSPSILSHVNHEKAKPNDEWVSYRGKVYCVNVGGDGIVFVRRNGKPCWCGNTPGTLIPEGNFPEDARWDLSGLPFPRIPGSIYHASKVASSTLMTTLCRIWELRASIFMQGVVYGTRGLICSDRPEMATRFDVDECFGTALNRFIAQTIIGIPMTLYGAGRQRRGFISLEDCCRTFELVLAHPPKAGTVETYNQIDQVYSIADLAEITAKIGKGLDLHPEIAHVPNPRKEAEDHTYSVAAEKLREIGYRPVGDLERDLLGIYSDLIPYRGRIEAVRDRIDPSTKWNPKEGK